MAGATGRAVEQEQGLLGVGQGDQQGVVAPDALVGQVHAFLASALVPAMVPSASRMACSKKALGCCCQTSRRLSLMTRIKRGDVLGLETAEEIAGGGGVGDTLGPQGVEIVLVVAEQFQVLETGAADQDVVGEVEDMVGLVVGEVAFEQVEFGVDGVGEAQTLDQQQAGAQAAEASAANFVGDVVVDVSVGEHAATLLLPTPLAQADARSAACYYAAASLL